MLLHKGIRRQISARLNGVSLSPSRSSTATALSKLCNWYGPSVLTKGFKSVSVVFIASPTTHGDVRNLLTPCLSDLHNPLEAGERYPVLLIPRMRWPGALRLQVRRKLSPLEHFKFGPRHKGREDGHARIYKPSARADDCACWFHFQPGFHEVSHQHHLLAPCEHSGVLARLPEMTRALPPSFIGFLPFPAHVSPLPLIVPSIRHPPPALHRLTIVACCKPEILQRQPESSGSPHRPAGMRSSICLVPGFILLQAGGVGGTGNSREQMALTCTLRPAHSHSPAPL